MASIEPFQITVLSGKKIDFRSLHAGDEETFLKFLARIPHESFHTNQYIGIKKLSPDEVKVRIEKIKADPVTLDIGAFDGPRLIGFLNFRKDYPDHPWQQHLGRFGMMVLKDYWGLGIGKRLLETFEPHAVTCGIKKIEAEVRVANERGVSLYKNAGYQIEGRRTKAVKIEGEWGDEYYIAKFLDKKTQQWNLPTLETSRLILRPLTIADAENIYAYAKNPNVSRFTLWEPHASAKDSLCYINDYAFRYYQEGIPEPFGVELKSEPGRVIGTAGCRWVSMEAKSMELAYALDEQYWGKGLMPEACQAVIDYCFTAFSLKRIQGRCKKENLASARIMQKIGMSYEGTLSSAIFHRNRHWDMCYYALIR